MTASTLVRKEDSAQRSAARCRACPERPATRRAVLKLRRISNPKRAVMIWSKRTIVGAIGGFRLQKRGMRKRKRKGDSS